MVVFCDTNAHLSPLALYDLGLKTYQTSEKSEMVIYKDVYQVVRNRGVNQQATKVDSMAILLIIAVNIMFGPGFESWGYHTK